MPSEPAEKASTVQKAHLRREYIFNGLWHESTRALPENDINQNFPAA
jgi:hypothetical protein